MFAIQKDLLTLPRLLTAAQVAILCTVSEKTVYRWASTGVLPAVRPGGSRLVRFRFEDVERLMKGA